MPQKRKQNTVYFPRIPERPSGGEARAGLAISSGMSSTFRFPLGHSLHATLVLMIIIRLLHLCAHICIPGKQERQENALRMPPLISHCLESCHLARLLSPEVS